MDGPEPQSKQQILEGLLEKGMVMVVLDARRPGVAVPPKLADDPQLRLNLSWRFGYVMQLDDEGVQATLTFGGMPFTCRLPWGSIYAMVSHVSREQVVFPTELPDELKELAARAARDDEDEDEAGEVTAVAEPPPPARPRLAVVEPPAPPRAEGEPAPDRASDADATPGRRDDDAPPSPPAGRPHLRLVK